MDLFDDQIDDDLFDEIIEFEEDVGKSEDKENQKCKQGNKAKKLQMNKLKAFMKEHSEFCIDKETLLWKNLVRELNELGPTFSDSEWKLKWSQHKYNNKRKLATEIAGPSLNDEPVVEQTVTLPDILHKLVEITEKQDMTVETLITIVETLKTTNILLEKVMKRLNK